MNERERAEVVARAIDALLDGAATDNQSARAKGDIQSLIEIARKRLRSSLFIARASLQHEETVWLSVVDRLQHDGLEAVRGRDELPADDPAEFAEVIAMRMCLADDAARVAEDHRQEVWERIQSRLSDTSRYSGTPHVLRRFRRQHDTLSSVESEWTVPPSRRQAAIPPAIPRLAMGYVAEGAQQMARERVWARVTARVPASSTPESHQAARKTRAAPGFALAAAAAAVVAMLALGPLPATGFAHHPAARLAAAIGDYFGASEGTAPPLAQLLPPTLVTGTSMGADDASQIAGINFSEPGAPPPGFELKSSRYYPMAISGGEGGTFVVMYSSSDATLMIYQEPAGGAELAAETGTLSSVALADGTPATLIQGSWSAGDRLSWSAGSSQALLFERAGVRVIVELQSASPGPSLLFEAAETLH